MLIFDTLVYEGWVGTEEVYCDPALHEPLGRPTRLRFQVDVRRVTGSPALTVRFYDSDDDESFTLNSVIVNGTTISALPTSLFGNSTLVRRNGAFGRVGFAVDTGAVYVRAYACGRKL